MGYSRYYAANPGLVLSGEQRATLVRRTYSLVLACVFITMGGTWFGLQNESILVAVAQHGFITFLLTLAPLWAASAMRSLGAPQRLGLVALFSGMMGVSISPAIYLAAQRAPDTVWQAGLLTASAFTVLTAYAWISRRDFSAWGAFFVVGMFVLVAASVLNYFFGNQTAYLWIAAIGVLVFSGLLVFDTWRLRNVFGPDDYIVAALQIYLDLLNMFMFILALLGGRRSNN
ncbi:MAG TPA: Bax inhibitor-1/YccA family protein [Gemmatimonadaceae bacterium]|nr:Bax inhibitor-1/YccA family protein [Gemmatimonadaceae bacterium]